jgi:hypothetical protein
MTKFAPGETLDASHHGQRHPLDVADARTHIWRMEVAN